MLEEVTLGTGGERFGDASLIAKRSKHKYFALGILRTDQTGCLDPVEVGHRQIHEHDVGAFAKDHLESFVAVSRDADEFNIGNGAQQLSEACANHHVVVDDNDSYHVRSSLRRLMALGISTST